MTLILRPTSIRIINQRERKGRRPARGRERSIGNDEKEEEVDALTYIVLTLVQSATLIIRLMNSAMYENNKKSLKKPQKRN